MPIYRIRKYFGRKGSFNYYYHADVKANSPEEAYQLASTNKVHNWRLIDKFDESNEDYCTYEYLYELQEKHV
jgi:hypothetical protein